MATAAGTSLTEHWLGQHLVQRLFGHYLEGGSVAVPEQVSPQECEIIVRHRLGPLLWRAFGSASKSRSNLAIAAIDLKARADAKRQLAALGDVAQALRGVEYVILKGLPVSVWLYGEPHLRASSDIDILIDRREYRYVQGRLAEAGFHRLDRASSGLEETFVRREPDGQWSAVDLHLEPWSGRSTWAGLRRRSTACRVGQLDLPVPSPSDQLGLLVDHYLHDGGGCLLLLLDVLMAERRAIGTTIESREKLGLVLREGARWGLSPRDAGTVSLKWAVVDRGWALERRPSVTWKSYLRVAVGLYADCVMRPRHCPLSMMRALWPEAARDRWVQRVRRLVSRH